MSAASIAVRGIEHVGLLARDPVALAAWYRATFGATVVSRSGDDPPVLFLGFGAAALLELIPTTDTRLSQPSDHVHLCLTVASLDSALVRLRDAGIAPVREPFAAYDGSMVAFLADPEGNAVQLVERVAGSAIHRTVYG